MKILVSLVIGLLVSTVALATEIPKEKPTQHLRVADVTSMQEAKAIFLEKTADIKKMKSVGPQEAAQLHIMTYSLEKSVEYFVVNLKGKKQEQAKKIAVIVEDIHITSERNRLEELRKHLYQYANLVDEFLFCF